VAAYRRMRAGMVTALLCLIVAGTAAAAPAPPFGHAGGFVTDSTGRVFMTHGVNMVYKVEPYEPSAAGFGDDDAAFLAREGFNSVRLGVIYKAVERQPGVYDDAYLANVAETAAMLAKRHIAPLVDFHQDMYNEKYQGEGWPDWAVIDDGVPNQPLVGFSNNYLVNGALNRAFDNFWANTPGPGGVGIGDRFAQAWKHVSERFAGENILGYDLLNEPWPGNGWQQCVNPTGCPDLVHGRFADFYKRTLAALRQGDAGHLAFYEPAVLFNFGSGTQLPKFDDPRVAMSWHVYCLSPTTGATADACAQSERLPFQNAQKRTAETGHPTLVTEFGATEDLADIKRIADYADEHKVGWQYWHYCGCNDPTTQGPGETQAIVKDPAKAPEGDNLKTAKLGVLVRPYPQLTAGTPSGWKFDAAKKVFTFEYATRRAGGGTFEGRPLTEVFVPKRQYAEGYGVSVRGAGVASPAGAQLLELRACPGAKTVEVTVAPGLRSSEDCSAGGVAGIRTELPRLRVTAAPHRVHRGRTTTFRFRVRSGRFAVRGAQVRFAGHSARTNARGRAKIRVTLRRAGARRAIALKRTYRRGMATVRVVH
jgi:endoglycosylceramidase